MKLFRKAALLGALVLLHGCAAESTGLTDVTVYKSAT